MGNKKEGKRRRDTTAFSKKKTYVKKGRGPTVKKGVESSARVPSKSNANKKKQTKTPRKQGPLEVELGDERIRDAAMSENQRRSVLQRRGSPGRKGDLQARTKDQTRGGTSRGREEKKAEPSVVRQRKGGVSRGTTKK